jgi:putative addiction module killer protein
MAQGIRRLNLGAVLHDAKGGRSGWRLTPGASLAIAAISSDRLGDLATLPSFARPSKAKVPGLCISAGLERLRRLERGNAGDAKRLGGSVTEIRVDYGPDYRVYFTRRGNTVAVLLCGGDKRTQDADIARAPAARQRMERLMPLKTTRFDAADYMMLR